MIDPLIGLVKDFSRETLKSFLFNKDIFPKETLLEILFNANNESKTDDIFLSSVLVETKEPINKIDYKHHFLWFGCVKLTTPINEETQAKVFTAFFADSIFNKYSMVFPTQEKEGIVVEASLHGEKLNKKFTNNYLFAVIFTEKRKLN